MTAKPEQDHADQADGTAASADGPADPAPAEDASGAGAGPAEVEVPIEEDEGESPAVEPEAPAVPVDEVIRKLEAKCEGLQAQVGQHKDRWLRVAADFENFRKRTARQETETLDRARVEALRAFLPVIDNVERALAFAKDGAAAETIADGLRLVVRSFFDAFASQGLQRFESVGQAFDPGRHEAVGQVETADVPPGAIVQELQSGYLLRTRLLRPAFVTVAKPPAKPAAAAAAAAPQETPTAEEATTGDPSGGTEGAKGA